MVRHAKFGGQILGFVRSRPITAFFLLACGLSWLAYVPYLLSESGLGVLAFRFPKVLGTEQLLGIVPGGYLGPLGSAIIVTWISHGRAGLWSWLRGLLRWRCGWRWYAIALLGPIVLTLAGLAVLPGAWHGAKWPSLATLAIYLPFLVMQVLITGVAEEPGWRGFAQPRLQRRFGPLPASVLLGAGWAIWHWPLFFTEWSRGGADPLTMFVVMPLSSIATSIVLSWLVNRTGGVVLIAMLWHAGGNATVSILMHDVFPSAAHGSNPRVASLIAVGLVALGIVLTTRGRLGYQIAKPRESVNASSVLPTTVD